MAKMTPLAWLQEVRLGLAFYDALSAWEAQVKAARAAGAAEARERTEGQGNV